MSATLYEYDLNKLDSVTCRNLPNCSCHKSLTDKGFISGGTSFILHSGNWKTSYIILRSIMTSLGYKCSEGEDFYWEHGNCDVIVETNYPYERYENLNKLKNEMDINQLII